MKNFLFFFSMLTLISPTFGQEDGLSKEVFQSQWQTLLTSLGQCKSGTYPVSAPFMYFTSSLSWKQTYKIIGYQLDHCLISIDISAPPRWSDIESSKYKGGSLECKLSKEASKNFIDVITMMVFNNANQAPPSEQQTKDMMKGMDDSCVTTGLEKESKGYALSSLLGTPPY